MTPIRRNITSIIPVVLKINGSNGVALVVGDGGVLTFFLILCWCMRLPHAT